MINNILPLCLVVVLSACAATPDNFASGDPVQPLTNKEKMLISARNAALEQQHGNIATGALSKAEKAYRTSPSNTKAAFDYAHLLRKVGMIGQAEMVLKPFAIDPKKANEDILIEYAKIQLKKGDFETAQIFAQEAMMIVDTAQARMILGVAVDAQGHHQAAENHFRVAMDKARLDVDLQNAIKNNLALALLAQGKSSEAESLLSSINSHGDIIEGGVIDANRKMSSKL